MIPADRLAALIGEWEGRKPPDTVDHDMAAWLIGRGVRIRPPTDPDLRAALERLLGAIDSFVTKFGYEDEWEYDPAVTGARAALQDSRPEPKGDSMSDIPRRHQMLRWCEAEHKIQAAVDAVEVMDADVRLTDAVILLGRARERVADFVDGVSGAASPPEGANK